MTTRKSDDTVEAKPAKTEVVDTYAEALEKGYFGVVPDPVPNSAYSLESGPDAPPLHENDRTPNVQTAFAPKEK